MAFAHWMLSLHSSVQPAGYVRGLLLPVLLHLLLLLLLHLLFFVCLACFCLLHAVFQIVDSCASCEWCNAVFC